MNQITPEILNAKLHREQIQAEIKEIEKDVGPATARSASIFTHAYFGRFPVDVNCIGTICDASLWPIAKMPEDMPHPHINPVWDFEMPESCQGMGYHYWNWLFMLVKVELNHGYPASNDEYSVIYSAIDELYVLDTINLPHTEDEKVNKEIFVPGTRVGLVQYPTSSGHDAWIMSNPDQESLDQIEIHYM